jgi:hypothetical protein
VNAELTAALHLDRDIRLRGAQETTELPEGFVVRHPGLPAIHFLNALLLGAPVAAALDAAAVRALAERWLGQLPERYVAFDDAEAAERLAPELLRGGARRRRTLFMVYRGAGRELARDARAREIGDAELRALQLQTFQEADLPPGAPPGLPEMLVEAQAELRSGTTARGFGSGEDGALASMATLFLEPDLGGRRAAMVEEVATLSAHRERGLARAVVSTAVSAAVEWGAELITVPCDADDWPQLMYARLGFAPVGMQVSFTLPAG